MSESAASGSSSTFDGLVAEHSGRVARLCRSILRDDDLAADAAQETFLRLWQRVRGASAPERVGPWLRRAAASASLDLVRRREVRERHRTDAPLDEESDAGRTPLERAGQAELQHRLELALDLLSEGQRTVFLLRHEGGLTLREVAEALDVSLPTVKTQFARACLKVQERLAPFRPEHEDDRR